MPKVALSFDADQLKGPKSKSFGIVTVLSKIDGLGHLLNCLRDLFAKQAAEDHRRVTEEASLVTRIKRFCRSELFNTNRKMRVV